MQLAAANPFGPIFGKELRVMSRRRRSYALRVAYLGVLLLVLLLAWTTTGTYGSGAAAAVQRQNQLGRTFFAFFAVFSVTAMGLIGPVLTATAINSERAAKTLNVLLMTPITATQIVLGKLLSRLLAALTLIGLSLPALAVVRLLGGVELEQMVGAVCVATATAVVGASLGLLLSVVMRRAWAVILVSYFALLLLWLFVPLLIALVAAGSAWGPNSWLANGMVALSPAINITLLSEGSGLRAGLAWWPGVAVAAGESALFLLLAIALVKRTVRREGEPAAREVKAAAENLVKPQAAETSRVAREVGENPILWRELRQPLLRGRGWSLAAAVVAIGLLGLFYVALANQYRNELLDHDTHIGFALVFHGLFWLLAAVLGATAVASEKEGDTWDVLIATPLDGRTILWGKFLGVMRRLLWPAVLVAGHFALFTLFDETNNNYKVLSPVSAALAVGVILCTNVLWVATGIALSVRLRKVTTAVVLNLALAVALYGLVPLLMVLLGFSASKGRTAEHFVEWTGLYVPMAYEVTVLDRLTPFEPLDGHSWVWPVDMISESTFAWVTAFYCLAHLALAGLILRLSAAGFDRTVGRAGSRGRLG